MHIIWQDDHAGHAAGMLFEVGDKLSTPDLPDAHLTLHATAREKLVVERHAQCRNSIFVRLIYCPKRLRILHTERPYLPVVPS